VCVCVLLLRAVAPNRCGYRWGCGTASFLFSQHSRHTAGVQGRARPRHAHL
jgi:hypothetical protein